MTSQRIATRLHYGQRVPAWYDAPQRLRQSQIDQWRAIAAEAREPVHLIDDPENRSGWADAQPPYPVGLLFASLGCVLIAAVTLIASAIFA